MAACTDHLMRAYLRAPVRTREIHGYLVAEYGACAEAHVLRALIASTGPRRRPRTNALTSLRGNWRRSFLPSRAVDRAKPREARV